VAWPAVPPAVAIADWSVASRCAILPRCTAAARRGAKGSVMRKVVLGILAAFGVLTVVGVVLVLAMWLVLTVGHAPVPGAVVLEADLEQGVLEGIPDDPLAQLTLEDALTVWDVVDALERGAEDRRVKGFVARIGGGGMGLAHAQELRDAVQRFRASGKPAIAFAETFGEFGPGNGGYYLATAFDEIYLQPSGDVGLTGLYYETPFVRGLLDKLDVVPRMGQRHEYKNAMNTYTHRAYTGPHREAMQRLVDSQFGQIVAGISAARGMTEEAVRGLVDEGPFLAPEAQARGLVDGLSYRDEVWQHVRDRVGEDARFLYLKPYLERAGAPHRRGTTVALIQGFGTVTRGPSGYSPFDGSTSMGSDTIAGALRAAIDDRGVKAILLRVDSPGGSYVASDTIWRETVRAREAGKPVVVSMGNLAASGGYFVSMNADRIVAEPGTITASIGVLGGKLITAGLWGKLGISFDAVRSSANSAYWSSEHDCSAAGLERFEGGLDRVYEDFTSKVAAGRRIDLDEVRKIARGRIWTGEDALRLGLVDALGGRDVALDEVRRALGLETDAPLRLKRFPARRGTFDLFFGARPDRSARSAAVALARSLRVLQPLLRTLGDAGLGPDAGVLSVPRVGELH